MATTRARLAAIGVAGALTAAATISALTPALAQDATQAPTEETTREQQREERDTAFATALAGELDLPVERVRTAVDSVREEMRAEARERHLAKLKERLDAAVADGTLTQEQADAIFAAAESGAMPFGRGGRHGGRGSPRGGWGGPPASGGAPTADAPSA